MTDHGRPAHVLMTFKDYQRLTKQRRMQSVMVLTRNTADFAHTGARLVNP